MKNKSSKLVVKVEILEINGQITHRPFPELVMRFDNKLKAYLVLSANGTDIVVSYKDFLNSLKELKK
jgi:hypothetical protein